MSVREILYITFLNVNIIMIYMMVWYVTNAHTGGTLQFFRPF